jgi:hypothetical protein
LKFRTCSQSLLADSPLPIRDRFEFYVPPSLPHHINATSFEPTTQIFALADVEQFKVTTAFDDRFDARARDSDAATDTEITKFEEVQGDAS